jgi:hypothetical protein
MVVAAIGSESDDIRTGGVIGIITERWRPAGRMDKLPRPSVLPRRSSA